jgi:hypothetical protein
MSAADKELKRAKGNIIGPNYYDKTKDEYGITEGSDGATHTKLTGSNVAQPVDIQARYAQTIQTHSGVTIAPSGNSTQSSYIDCDGFDRIAVTSPSDANHAGTVELIWSNDGSSIHFYDTISTAATGTRGGETSIKARYVKVNLKNADAAPHTMNAWAYLKA